MLDFREGLIQEAKATAAAEGGGTSAAFVGIVASYLVGAEILPDFQPAFYLGTKGNRRLRVDGYVLDEFDGTLNLVVANFQGEEEAHTLTRTESERLFDLPLRFIEAATTTDLYRRIEMSTPASDLVDLLRENKEKIRRYRVLLFSDGMMSGRIEALPIKDVGGIPAECQIWDVSRLYKVCLADMGQESIEIDFAQYSRNGLPCLETSNGGGDSPYASLLAVIPGTVLANIYDRYGSRLLEGNVRSFLSTKVAVNKQIRATILNEPAMFFALNNGISATATEVEIETGSEGRFITYARNFQIINGGQTTASLSNARHRDKADLSAITVQMKLTKINAAPEETVGIVQKIARSSNSQNKVSDADFFSTHPFHVRMEQISRRLFAPAAGGAQHDTRWFYERARGQYLQEQMRMTDAQRKKFLTQNPKEQLVTKTDLAKVRNSWRGLPQVVSKGAQTNFMEFAVWVDNEWSASTDVFNERFYQESVALFILFKHIERLVTHQEWYQHGYRANIVTYSVALLAHLIKKQYPKQFLDLRNIWNRQSVPEALTKQLLVITEAVMVSITDPNRPVVNVTQWCKREACWTQVKALPVKLGSISNFLVSEEEARAEGRTARQVQQIDSGIEAQTEVVKRDAGYWRDVQGFFTSSRLKLSPDEKMALQIACQLPLRIPNPLQCRWLLSLAERAVAEGFKAG